MRGLYFNGKEAEYREDLPRPQREPHQSLIRILVADICSTDREILKGYRPDFKGVMGHEFCGIVEESGDPSLIGKLVVGELNEGCGTCLYCRTGREKHCLSRRVIGMSKDGCFAEYMTLATHLIHPVPDNVQPENAVFAEPLAAALEILEQVHINDSVNTAIIGDGRLAFMIAQVLALTGTDLTVIGHHPEKLSMFDPYAKTISESSLIENGCIRSLTADECYEFVVDASGSSSGFDLAMRLVRRMGTIVLKSTYAGKSLLDMSLIPVNEITVVGSRCGPFEPALRLLAEGRVQFPPVELYDISDWRKAFDSKAFKAGFFFGR